MGLPIYMDYYTVHDDDNNKIGFAPRAGSSKEKLRSGVRPTRVLESTNPADQKVSPWSWIISSLLILSFMVCWTCVICNSLSNRKDRVNPGAMVCIAIGFIITFSVIVFFYIQPIINDWIVDNEKIWENHSQFHRLDESWSFTDIDQILKLSFSYWWYNSDL